MALIEQQLTLIQLLSYIGTQLLWLDLIFHAESPALSLWEAQNMETCLNVSTYQICLIQLETLHPFLVLAITSGTFLDHRVHCGLLHLAGRVVGGEERLCRHQYYKLSLCV